ncbi:ATP-binding protein [Candidatus Margulisiibacteriota bacterium]
MPLEIIRNVILMIGWPALAAGSILLLYLSYKFYLDVNKVIFGKLVLIMTGGWLFTMYCLGIVATVAMFLNVTVGVFVVLPIFIVWAITIVILSASVIAWTKEAVKINDFYQDIERKYQSIFEVSPEAILLLDPQGSIIASNQRLQEWSGYSNEQIIGASIVSLPFIAEKSKSAIKDKLLKLSKRSPEIEFINKQGETKFGQMVEAAMEDAKTKLMRSLIMISDITEKKQLEKLQEDLIHMIVHDLKNPLGVINLAIYNLMNGIFGELVEAQKQVLQEVHFSAKKMSNLTMDILQIKAMEDKTFNLNKTNFLLPEFIKELSWFKALCQKQGLTFNFDVDDKGELFADIHILVRVLENFLSNAQKHTPKGGTITLSIKPLGNSTHFEVTDSGEGIPQESLEKIFDKFFKVSGQQYSTHVDTGLGLAFCKMAVEAHRGQINVESEVGKGTKFSFTIPSE